METRIIVDYKRSEDTNIFGTYALSFKDSNSEIHKVNPLAELKR